MERLQNVSINGMGEVNGGSYDRVTISGLGKLIGNVDANSITINGSGTIQGDACTEKIVVNGNGKISGVLQGETLENNGNLTVSGFVELEEVVNRGRLSLDGSLTAKKVGSAGLLQVAGNLATTEFKSQGSFRIDGDLNAQTAHIEVGGSCTVREIRAEQVTVAELTLKSFPLLEKLWSFFMNEPERTRLRTGVIEGVNVSLDRVEAKHVRGINVTVGPDCFIELVEYAGELSVDPRATVRNTVKVEPKQEPAPISLLK